tara:strand:- start:5141 stop:7396 length:2256 start_codon:yes stop_codon:yes gene_type:complete
MLENFRKSALDILAVPDLETGEVPESRLLNADSARAIYKGLVDDDRVGSYNRSIVQELLNNVPPYSQSKREEEGQGELYNLNTGHGKLITSNAASGIMDIFESDRNLVSIPLSTKIPGPQKTEAERHLATRFSEMLRDWDCFATRLNDLCCNFVDDGAGVLFFEDVNSWKVGSAGRSDIKFPVNCEPVSSQIPIAAMKRELHVGDLWRKIRNEGEAAKQGWDAVAVRKAIHSAATSKGGDWKNWEKLEEDLLANEAYVSHTVKPIPIIYIFLEELDGSVSFFTTPEKDGEFLQKQISKYKSMNEAFQVFPYSSGKGNRLATVRGMGHFIYQLCNAENISTTDLLNAAKLNSLPQYEVDGTEQLQDTALVEFGAFGTILAPGVRMPEKQQTRDLGQSLIPAMSIIDSALRKVSGNIGEVDSFGERANSDNISATLEEMNAMNSASITLFYPPLDRIYAEMVARIFRDEKDTPESIEMKRLLIEEDGLSEDIFNAIQWSGVKAIRVLGGGSKANQMNALKDIRSNTYGSMDAQGRKNNDYDYILNRAGKQAADSYIGPPNQTRKTYDDKIAELENNQMLDGAEIEPNDGEDHLVHLEVHLEVMMATKDLVESGELELTEYTLKNLPIYKHCQNHLEMIVPNDVTEQSINEITAQVQRLGEFFMNGMKAIEKEQRDAEDQQQQQGAAGEEQESRLNEAATESQMKVEKFQLDQQLKKAESDAKIIRENNESQAKMAIDGALAASKIRGHQPKPQ